jgi:hypothetical protein
VSGLAPTVTWTILSATAILSVTHNWNPGGGAGSYDDHPVGVRYDARPQEWAIYNTDDSAKPDGASFNVAVSGYA